MDRGEVVAGLQGSTGRVGVTGTRSSAGRGYDGVDLPGGRMVTSAAWSGEALALPRSGCSGDHAAVAHSHSEVMPVARRDRRSYGGHPRPGTASRSKAVSTAGVCWLAQRERKATCTPYGVRVFIWAGCVCVAAMLLCWLATRWFEGVYERVQYKVCSIPEGLSVSSGDEILGSTPCDVVTVTNRGPRAITVSGRGLIAHATVNAWNMGVKGGGGSVVEHALSHDNQLWVTAGADRMIGAWLDGGDKSQAAVVTNASEIVRMYAPGAADVERLHLGSKSIQRLRTAAPGVRLECEAVSVRCDLESACALVVYVSKYDADRPAIVWCSVGGQLSARLRGSPAWTDTFRVGGTGATECDVKQANGRMGKLSITSKPGYEMHLVLSAR